MNQRIRHDQNNSYKASCKKCRTILTQMPNSESGAGNIQYEPGAPHCAKKEVLKEKCSDGGMSQEHRSQSQELSVAKMERYEQDNVSTMDSNPKSGINTNRSIML